MKDEMSRLIGVREDIVRDDINIRNDVAVVSDIKQQEFDPSTQKFLLDLRNRFRIKR